MTKWEENWYWWIYGTIPWKLWSKYQASYGSKACSFWLQSVVVKEIIFSLNYSSGYLHAFDVYQGNKVQNTDYNDMFGVEWGNVLSLIIFLNTSPFICFLTIFLLLYCSLRNWVRETFLWRAPLEKIELEAALYQPWSGPTEVSMRCIMLLILLKSH